MNATDNIKIFLVLLKDQTKDTCYWDKDENKPRGKGFYHWFCFPGCLPEGDPVGPFQTFSEAQADVMDTHDLAECEECSTVETYEDIKELNGKYYCIECFEANLREQENAHGSKEKTA